MTIISTVTFGDVRHTQTRRLESISMFILIGKLVLRALRQIYTPIWYSKISYDFASHDWRPLLKKPRNFWQFSNFLKMVKFRIFWTVAKDGDKVISKWKITHMYVYWMEGPEPQLQNKYTHRPRSSGTK